MSWNVITGDCISVLPTISPRPILIVADPPYNQKISYGSYYDDNKTDSDYLLWCHRWIESAYSTLGDDGSFWLLCSHEYVSDIDVIARRVGFHRRQWITWFESFGVNCKGKFNRCSRPLLWYSKHKTEFIFNSDAPEVRRPSDRQAKYSDARAANGGLKLWDDCWGINPPIPRVCGTFKERIKGFPTQLPLKLLRPIIAVASNPGDTCLDPFSGSASLGHACLELGRNFVGIELSEQYAELSRERLRKVEHDLRRQGLEHREADRKTHGGARVLGPQVHAGRGPDCDDPPAQEKVSQTH
jgi:site-specific DNA-methyltransferase (adenine-specific)